jgi:RNA-binding protein
MNFMSHSPLSSRELSSLKARSQKLEPYLRVGKAGLSDSFIAQVEEALRHHDLIKIKFDGHKDEKKELAPLIAEKTNSLLILRVGHTATYFRAAHA